MFSCLQCSPTFLTTFTDYGFVWICHTVGLLGFTWKQTKCTTHCQGFNLCHFSWGCKCKEWSEKNWLFRLCAPQLDASLTYPGLSGNLSALWQKTKKQTLRRINLLFFWHEHIFFLLCYSLNKCISCDSDHNELFSWKFLNFFDLFR